MFLFIYQSIHFQLCNDNSGAPLVGMYLYKTSFILCSCLFTAL